MNKYKIIAIMGKSGSGKDSLCLLLLKLPELFNSKSIISYTTRPRRDNETNHVDYHFITNEEFTDKILNGTMLEATVFNNWGYGTSIEALSTKDINIGVFNPEGCEALRDNKDIDLFLVYIEANDKDRLLRQLNRESNPDCHEIIRRFSADEMDFSEEEIEFLSPDMFITNNNGANLEQLAHIVAQTINTLWVQGQNK